VRGSPVTSGRSGSPEPALASSANASAAGTNTMATRAAARDHRPTDRNRRSAAPTLPATEPPLSRAGPQEPVPRTRSCQRGNLPTPSARGNVCTRNRMRLWRRELSGHRVAIDAALRQSLGRYDFGAGETIDLQHNGPGSVAWSAQATNSCVLTQWIRCRAGPCDASSGRTRDRMASPDAWSRSCPRSPSHRPPSRDGRHSPGESCGR
jgi:hypothetical protein